jgi:leucyl/phenylalanyl-tRNA---protein transferase
VQPIILHPSHLTQFPDPGHYDNEGLVAVGGDLSPQRLLLAYDHGIFPWYNERYPPLWWCPNPRAVMPLGAPRVSRSMRRTLRKHDFEVTWDAAFGQVIRSCGTGRREGTWILPEVIEAYELLHRQGHAHSLEVWQTGKLVGGLYGVQRGALFAAESMFHRVTDMSKVALLYAVSTLSAAGVELLDVQFLTPHLASLGAEEITRPVYLQRLREAVGRAVSLRGLSPVSPIGASE